MDWNAAAPSAIVGAVVATAGVLIVELLLKPAVARRRVALILSAEVKLNLKSVRSVLKHRAGSPDTVPWDVALSTRAWSCVAQEVHLLPEEVVGRLLSGYAQMDEVNNVAREHVRRVDMMLQQPAFTPELRALDLEAQSLSALFGEVLRSTAAACERLEKDLEKVVSDSPS
jgi:hypothetical protein